ncbi:AN1-type zinc finger domain-containing protein [Natrinema sp. SYSU A 869]|uniref:AN1-type zinc finger domain-containing protein n=1 Tax=Natrinema sp. SYSU A 869 TaxID=2871694 RepID=UPI001CA46CC9|nr:AN1-type zinc finger domain-containing protein [Natrinema sp. SYSU A 869]
MAQCDESNCRGDEDFSHTCSYCGGRYCSDHRMPEAHSCPALATASTQGLDFRGGTISDLEERREASTSEKKQCTECSNFVPPDKDLCLSCRRDPIDDTSPDVSIKTGDPEPEQSTESSTGPGFLTSIKFRLEMVGIRVRGWMRSVVQFGSIGMFLLGIYAIVKAYATVSFGPLTFLEFEVPAAFGSSRMTLLVGGTAIMIVGLALSFKLIFGSASPQFESH